MTFVHPDSWASISRSRAPDAGGIGFTIGAGAAIVSLVWGGLVVGPAGKRAAAIQHEVAARDGVAPTAQRAELDAIRRRLNAFAMADLTLLGTAVVTMATARYW